MVGWDRGLALQVRPGLEFVEPGVRGWKVKLWVGIEG